MTTRTVILRSVQFYWRTHLGVILGAALGALVLTGALLVGDSVKATLRRQAELRIGKADIAMTSGDRFFRAALADAAGAEAAPVLALRATVARADGAARVNVAQLLGVDERFWILSRSSEAIDLPNDGVALNSRLAQQLGASVGDTVIVRVEKPGAFSKDAPLSGDEDDAVALRVKVARIVDDEHYGRFALAASQVPPFTVFAPLAVVQEKLAMADMKNAPLTISSDVPNISGIPGLSDSTSDRGENTPLSSWVHEGMVNLILASPEYSIFDPDIWIRIWGIPIPFSDHIVMRGRLQRELEIVKRQDAKFFAKQVRSIITLEDAQLSLLDLPNNSGLELRTTRVFLDPPVVASAPRGKDERRVDSLTYFVNELRAGDKATPYSMVTAIEAPSSGFLPAELADDEIVISQWEADDLGIATGAKVMLKFFTMGERRELVEKSREFTVLAVLPMDEPQLNSSWMPDFPGLKDAKNCRDWKPGFDIDMTKMREKDNDYWLKYRGTPKAFVNLKVGQEMWGNRWGNTTSLRWPAGTNRAEIENALREKITPEMLGFQFIPLREQAFAATNAPVDFGELFVSFSFFLIVAAAVLTGLLFVFSLEQRNAEAGLLLALGLRPRQVRRMFLLEGAALAVIGSVLGAAGAAIYTKLVLRALTTVWRGAVGAMNFEFVMPPATLAIGVISGVLIALLAMWLASRRQMRRSARELLAGHSDSNQPRIAWPGSFSGKLGAFASFLSSKLTGIICLVGAIIITVFGGKSPEMFFGAGSMLLIAGLAFAFGSLRKMDRASGIENLTQLGVRNAARRRGRSLATIAVLASGVFMVVAVDSFRHGPISETARRDSGTGGFALVGESSAPIYDDLNSEKGREQFALDEKAMSSVNVVPMRVREGDDASCLNLNRAMQPRLLGVNPREMQTRFHFAESGASWDSLDSAATEDPVPGIVDATTLEYSLQKRLGDVLEYRDERGALFHVKLVATLSGSILQGSVLISEKEFVRRFPNQGGCRFFLVDAPVERIADVRAEFSRALQDRGLELTTTAQRLAEFQAVENTYLAIFQVLGGLGLLLGSAGLAIVVARNVLERRSEFGLLEAVGFRDAQLRSLVFAEHRWLIACGLAIGTLSALVAVWPNLRERANGFPYGAMALLLAAMILGCIFWTWIATWLALRGRGREALRSE